MRIALYKGKSWISKAIRWQTRMDYSHAAFVLADGSVIEAWQPCVRHVANLSIQHTPGTVVDLFAFCRPLSGEQEAMLAAWAVKQCGINYDYRSILRFVTRKASDGDRAKWFCSEMVSFGCEDVIGRALLHTEPWRIAPGYIAWSTELFHESTTTTQ